MGSGARCPALNSWARSGEHGGRGFAADPSYMPWSSTNPTYAVRDDVSKSVGRHTLQFGGQYVLAQRNQTNNAIGAASGDLQGLLTFSNLAHSTGNVFVDFLTQSVFDKSSARQEDSPKTLAQRRYYQTYQIAEPYFQDDWKVDSHLTLNLGLRVSLFGTYRRRNQERMELGGRQIQSKPLCGRSVQRSAPGQERELSGPWPLNPSTFQLDPSQW